MLFGIEFGPADTRPAPGPLNATASAGSTMRERQGKRSLQRTSSYLLGHSEIWSFEMKLREASSNSLF